MDRAGVGRPPRKMLKQFTNNRHEAGKRRNAIFCIAHFDVILDCFLLFYFIFLQNFIFIIFWRANDGFAAGKSRFSRLFFNLMLWRHSYLLFFFYHSKTGKKIILGIFPAFRKKENGEKWIFFFEKKIYGKQNWYLIWFFFSSLFIYALQTNANSHHLTLSHNVLFGKTFLAVFFTLMRNLLKPFDVWIW